MGCVYTDRDQMSLYSCSIELEQTAAALLAEHGLCANPNDGQGLNMSNMFTQTLAPCALDTSSQAMALIAAAVSQCLFNSNSLSADSTTKHSQVLSASLCTLSKREGTRLLPYY